MEIIFAPKASKFIKKCSRPLKEKLREIILEIKENPYSKGEELKGNLRGIYVFRFRESKTDYRIAYTIEHGKMVIIILSIGSRENFYRDL